MSLQNFGQVRQPTAAVSQTTGIQNEVLDSGLYFDVRYYGQEQLGVPLGMYLRQRAGLVNLDPAATYVETTPVADEDLDSGLYLDQRLYGRDAITLFDGETAFDAPAPTAPAPSIVSIVPNTGSEAGGEAFTINGANFASGATVTFDGAPATSLIVTSSQITGLTPAGTIGAVTVVVTNPDLQQASTSYTYTAVPVAPAFFEISPDLGLADYAAHFDPASNPLLVQLEEADLTAVGGSEGNVLAKGVGAFRITINGTVYEIPLAARRRLRARNGGRIVWRSTTGEAGAFRFFRNAPPVFEEPELVRN